MDPITGALLASSALSGLFNGLSQGSAQKNAAAQKRQFDMSNAPGVLRAQHSAPLRDKLMHVLSQRFGASPTTYADAQRSYQPSPQLEDQDALYRRLLQQMGYNWLSDAKTSAYKGPGGAPGPRQPAARYTQNPVGSPYRPYVEEFDEERGY